MRDRATVVSALTGRNPGWTFSVNDLGWILSATTPAADRTATWTDASQAQLRGLFERSYGDLGFTAPPTLACGANHCAVDKMEEPTIPFSIGLGNYSTAAGPILAIHISSNHAGVFPRPEGPILSVVDAYARWNGTPVVNMDHQPCPPGYEGDCNPSAGMLSRLPDAGTPQSVYIPRIRVLLRPTDPPSKLLLARLVVTTGPGSGPVGTCLPPAVDLYTGEVVDQLGDDYVTSIEEWTTHPLASATPLDPAVGPGSNDATNADAEQGLTPHQKAVRDCQGRDCMRR